MRASLKQWQQDWKKSVDWREIHNVAPIVPGDRMDLGAEEETIKNDFRAAFSLGTGRQVQMVERIPGRVERAIFKIIISEREGERGGEGEEKNKLI